MGKLNAHKIICYDPDNLNDIGKLILTKEIMNTTEDGSRKVAETNLIAGVRKDLTRD